MRRFVLTLWCFPDHIHIYVYDQDRTPPVLRPSPLEDNGGRGLHLVEEVSSKWGYTYPTPHPDSGKAVWAQLDFPGSPAPTDVQGAAQAVAIPRQCGVPTWRNDPATLTEVVTRLRDGVTRHGYASA
ncbi:ATP-binding protein [Streptomyces mirabilis]|uniref:ATP-binding protein n=1 Tax=Streptomyces mirabilis TaxID=68239 RepID=UPI0036A2AC49